jgi:hypothetical protein
MRMLKTAAIALLALAGCAAGAGPGSENKVEAGTRSGSDVPAYLAALEARFSAPGVVTAGFGRSARLGDVTVRPLAIVEDSRCPQDVRCVWAGRLRLRVAITPGPAAAELTIYEAYALPRGGTITLVVAAPERWDRVPPGIDLHAPARFGFRRDARKPAGE